MPRSVRSVPVTASSSYGDRTAAPWREFVPVPADGAAGAEAVVAGAEGDWEHWGALFARAVTETARHRTATVTAYGNLLGAALDLVAGDPAAAEVLGHLRSGPAVSAEWLRGRTAHDPGPALARLREARILVAHPRLRGALVHPGLLALLDAPYGRQDPPGRQAGVTRDGRPPEPPCYRSSLSEAR